MPNFIGISAADLAPASRACTQRSSIMIDPSRRRACWYRSCQTGTNTFWPSSEPAGFSNRLILPSNSLIRSLFRLKKSFVALGLSDSHREVHESRTKLLLAPNIVKHAGDNVGEPLGVLQFRYFASADLMCCKQCPKPPRWQTSIFASSAWT